MQALRVRGVLPYKNRIGVCAAPKVGFLSRFGPKTGTNFAYFGLESGVVEGTTVVHERVRRFNST